MRLNPSFSTFPESRIALLTFHLSLIQYPRFAISYALDIPVVVTGNDVFYLCADYSGQLGRIANE